MKKTILHKLLKWVVASSASLLALPISVFIIIFSLYPDLTTIPEFNPWKLKSYYCICDITNKNMSYVNSNPDTLFSKSISAKNINRIHLLIIDQTLSTVFEDVKLDTLKKYLRFSIRDSVKKNIDTTSLKSLIYSKIIEGFNLDYNCDTLFVYFYNGSADKQNSGWIEVSKDAFSPKILENINHSEGLDGQITDFRDVFEIIKAKIIKTENIDCITFLSDFYHEPKNDLTDKDFKDFKNISKNTKINLIALWKTSYSGLDKDERLARQNNFISRFDTYFQGVVAIEKIYVDKYNNSLYTGQGDLLEFEDMITFKPFQNEVYNQNDSTTITFFSPMSNSLKYHEAKVKIKLDTIGTFRWKIKSIFDYNKTFIKFNRNCDTTDSNVYRFNTWYEDECDSLSLSIKLGHDCNFDDLKFCYAVKDNGINKFDEYDINVKNFLIETVQGKLLGFVCNIFCILLIISITSAMILILIKLYL